MPSSQIEGFVYRFYAASGMPVYFGSTQKLTDRLRHHSLVRGVRDKSELLIIESFPTLRQAREAEDAAIKRELPVENRQGNPTRTSPRVTGPWDAPEGMPPAHVRAEELPCGARRYRYDGRDITVVPPGKHNWEKLERALRGLPYETSWCAQVSYRLDDWPVPEEKHDRLMDACRLAVADSTTHTLTLTLDLEADFLYEASQHAMRRTRKALTAAGIVGRAEGLECVLAREADQRALTPDVMKLLDLAGTAETAEILNVAKQQVAKLARTHADFPKPVDVLAAGPIYARSEIKEWGRNWTRKRTGRPAKAAGAEQ